MPWASLPSMTKPTRQMSSAVPMARSSLRTSIRPQSADPNRSVSTGETNLFRGYRQKGELAEPLDDRRVGHAPALAHRLQAVAAAGALELVEQGGHELGAGAAERVAEGDGAAVHV